MVSPSVNPAAVRPRRALVLRLQYSEPCYLTSGDASGLIFLTRAGPPFRTDPRHSLSVNKGPRRQRRRCVLPSVNGGSVMKGRRSPAEDPSLLPALQDTLDTSGSFGTLVGLKVGGLAELVGLP